MGVDNQNIEEPKTSTFITQPQHRLSEYGSKSFSSLVVDKPK